MEKYKKIIQIRRGIFLFCILLAVILGIYHTFFASETVKANIVFDFQCGFIMALGIASILGMIHCSRILQDEGKLQIQYNREHDERIKTIRAKAGMPIMLISSIIMIEAGIIIGYVNTVVFYTLIIAALCQLVAGCVVKLVYQKLL